MHCHFVRTIGYKLEIVRFTDPLFAAKPAELSLKIIGAPICTNHLTEMKCITIDQSNLA